MDKMNCWAVLIWNSEKKSGTLVGFVEDCYGSPQAQFLMFKKWPESKTNRNYFVRPAWSSDKMYYKQSVPNLVETLLTSESN